jgi:hypothetical protein
MIPDMITSIEVIGGLVPFVGPVIFGHSVTNTIIGRQSGNKNIHRFPNTLGASFVKTGISAIPTQKAKAHTIALTKYLRK